MTEHEMCLEDVARVRSYSMVASSAFERLWYQTRELDRLGVQGALVECGVWKGGCIALMALAHMRSGAPKRMIRLFDSFQGLPAPDPRVDSILAVPHVGTCDATLEENVRLIEEIEYPQELVSYHPGWYAETLPRVDESYGSIALLRLDCDWYESTKLSLNHLFPLVTVGGLIVIDDYGAWPGCKLATDQFVAQHRGEIEWGSSPDHVVHFRKVV